MKRVLLSIVCLVVSLSGPQSTSAGENIPNMDSNLVRLLNEWNRSGPAKASDFARANLIDIEEGAVQVTLRPERGETADRIDFDRLEALGVRVRSRSRSLVSAFVPVGALADVARAGGVAFVRRPLRPLPLAVTDEAVALTGADEYHSAGITGSGVKVAVIDGGFMKWNLARNNGDLPDSVHNYTYDFSGTGLATETEHGTAVAEAVHDMAPGTEIFLMKIGDSIDLENARDTCVALGVDVINHSMGWFGQPGDGSGAICAIADSAYRAGIAWVNSAGNHAHAHNEGTFTDDDSDGYHEFGPGDERITIQVPYNPLGSWIRVWLTWDAWPVTNEDYDLELVSQFGTVLATGDRRQADSASEPYELINYSVNSGTFYIKIYNYSTTTDHDFDLFVMDQEFQTYRVEGGSLLSPSDAEGVITVGAIDRNVYTTGPQESFSSRGPTNDGRLKPEICAPDNCNSYAYGYWFGTSLASPHVAGASALLLSAHPAWNPDSLRNGLITSAIDMGDAGPDSVYGYGRLDLPEPTAEPGDTTAPAVPIFYAARGDTSVILSWTAPSDPDMAGIKVVYSTAGYPLSPDSGAAVENGNGGVWPAAPSEAGNGVHGGLTNGTTYYYSAFAFDSVPNYSAAAQASATPADTAAPPGPLPSFTARAGEDRITLVWTNPSDPDFEAVVIRFNRSHLYPDNPEEGEPVPADGDGVFPGVPGAVDSFVHTGLPDRVPHLYTAFPRDHAPNYGEGAQATATPSDTTAPSATAAFHATPLPDGSIRLRWTHADTPDLAGTRIVFSISGPPASPSAGAPVLSGGARGFPGAPASVDSFLHVGLLPGTAYYYTAFSYDEVPNYSDGAGDSAVTAADEAPPGLFLGLLPNPYLAAYLDLYLVATESLDPDSVALTAGGVPVPMTRNDPSEEVWMGKTKLAGAGTIIIAAEAADLFGNGASVSRDLSYAKIGAGQTTVTSPDGVITASFGETAGESWAVLIPAADGNRPCAARSKSPPGDLPADEGSYTIGTAGPWPEGGADLVFRYDPARWSGVPPEEIAVEHSSDGVLAASIDTERSRIAALVSRPGSVRLVRDRSAPTRVAPAALVRLEQNTPNPFNPSTTIHFETGSPGRVRLTVHTLTGRKIRTLLEERLGPGLHEAVWSGTDDGGSEAASGIYLYRIVTENGSEARKMILIR